MMRPSIADICSYSVSNLSGSSPGFPGPQVSPVSGQEDKQCRYPAGNNNMADPVMNYAASLATASRPGTNIAAAAHFSRNSVARMSIVRPSGTFLHCTKHESKYVVQTKA